MKKAFLLLSSILLVIMFTFSASAEDDFNTLHGEIYTENEDTKIIDHVVYRLCHFGGKKHYDVYDWFDTKEAFETTKKINIVSEIDGIKVKGMQCGLEDSSEGSEHNYYLYHNYSVKEITIPDTIERIGGGFFSVFDGLEKLVVPASVKFTDSNYRCFDSMENLKKITFLGDVFYFPGGISDKLESVTVNGSVTLIAGNAFKNSTSLKSFKVLGSIGGKILGETGGIGASAFENCSSLEEFVFPKECGNFCIYKSAFKNCKALKTLTFPEECGNLTVGKTAFFACDALKSLTFPQTCGTLTIGNQAFKSSDFETITFPKKSGAISIGKYAFIFCDELTKVKNTDNIVEINARAFESCKSLKSITISDKTKIIGEYAFYDCRKLKTVYVNSKKNAPKLYRTVFAWNHKNIEFIAKNKEAAKSWKTALAKSGKKDAKVCYINYA